ncbi:hypothetical protein [Actinacidiphila sp. ITFR-21]|uniref:hypothetical protein n=1 Tax=Actinacidiphila sp. ITFR-21 TaxID=3075199 RepID=UPI00288918BC|nr:hypothetical protein [Streptomyces sp. ITFR-21]WNI16604.1 hypothetical protein RLT57_14525 [Streptomyces sp. ITFR-21]
MRAAVSWACRRLGYRGTALLISGVAYITYGASIAVQPRYGTVRGIAVLLSLAPMPVWGWGWIACGVLCLAYSVASAGPDWIGLCAAVVPPLLWAVAYAMGGALGASPTAWGAVAPWASHAALILIIARVTRPIPVVTRG